ncbi:keratin, type I cytoskeletal 13-like [Nematolebias whitei]|uniref:keratin, type I cytoskeletal 13-like n=1 Tax=Nematolebias whitei TaxID=451745 RepID=UPI001896AEEE|nr:keratin, type I cytoskeletal 13-like [Nematolebias whitei]
MASLKSFGSDFVRSNSVYGGAGGFGVLVSSPNVGEGFSSTAAAEGGFALSDALDIPDNEQAAMQNLNDRLASYLEKVRRMEEANAELELKIRQYLEGKAKLEGRDYSAFYATIRDLHDKILDVTKENRSLCLDIDSAWLIADHLKPKYEKELSMRQSIETDILALRRLLDELTLSRTDCEMVIEGLMEEMISLRKNHEEELMAMHTQVSGQVNVEVEAAPGEDITKIMEDMRQNYEALSTKNRKELEAWFQSKRESLNKKVTASTENLQTFKSEIPDLKRTLQALKIEHQSQLSMHYSLKDTLAETQNRYVQGLEGYQKLVVCQEAQLMQLREHLEQQGQEYQMLLDMKTRLEMEIEEYKKLLDREDGSE